jgi:hypothetical protein
MRTIHSWYQAPVLPAIRTAVTLLALTAALAFLSWAIAPPVAAQEDCVVCEACPSPLPASLTGSAKRVGLVPPPGQDAGAQIGLLVKFTFDGTLDLSASTVTIDMVLNEVGSAGELLPGLPITFSPRPGSTPTAAIYETPSRVIPKVRLEIRAKGDEGLFDWRLKVDRATIPNPPQLCSGTLRLTTNLTTSFVISDGGSEVLPSVIVPVRIEQPWRCLDLIDGDSQKPRSLRAP